MSWEEHARSLVAYNEWADLKVLEAAAPLSDDEFGRKVSGSLESARMTLIHIVRVQGWWLSVLNSKPDREAMRAGSEQMPFGEVKDWFSRSHGALRTYAAALTEERLASEVSVVSARDGKEYRWPSWQVLGHLMNHGSHHRAELGLMLASLGHSPGDLDFIFFLRGR